MNSVSLIGRLTRDPETRYTSGSNMAVTSFTLAIDGRDKTNYPRVKVFGRSAEACEKYLKKGKQVAVEGRIETDSYTNKDGKKMSVTEVVANRVEFLSDQKPAEKPQQEQFEEIDEDVPF